MQKEVLNEVITLSTSWVACLMAVPLTALHQTVPTHKLNACYLLPIYCSLRGNLGSAHGEFLNHLKKWCHFYFAH